MGAGTKSERVAPWKREVIDELLELFNNYPVVGVLDISELPALQFQQIRRKLRGEAEIVVSKNTLMSLAIQKASEKNQKLIELVNFLRGQSALIFSKMNPFKLNRFLRENRISAPARPGSRSTKDITIPAGETDFAPGPVVGELQRLGIKARIQAGKVVVLEDCPILKRGDIITREVSDALAKFGIMPLELGLKLRAAYEAGTVFTGEALEIDEAKVFAQFQEASMNALNLALNVNYPTSMTIGLMIVKASTAALNLALNACLPVPQVMPALLARSYAEMLALAAVLDAKNPSALDEELRATLGVAPPAETKPEEKPKEESKP
jgi:large subunit ribosomal protein L10